MSKKKKAKKPKPPPDPNEPLDNIRHERFIQEYVAAEADATLAYRRCYPKVSSDFVARRAAARLLTSVVIRQRIRALMRQEWLRHQQDNDRVIKELQIIAHADPADVFDFTPGNKADGFVTLKKPGTITPKARRTIQQITTTPVVVNGRVRYKVSVRFHDKNAAAEKLLRAGGVYRELTDLETVLASLPPHLRERVRRQIAEEQGVEFVDPRPEEPARREPLAVETAGGPDPAVQADGAATGPVAGGVPDEQSPAEGAPLLPAGGEDDDLGGLDLSKLFDDP